MGWGWGFQRPKHVKKCMKLNWNFQRGGEVHVLEKIPSMGQLWISSGTTHSCKDLKGKLVIMKKMLENHNRCTAYIVIDHDNISVINE